MKYIIILNPNSGKKESTTFLEKIVIPVLEQKNIIYDIHITKYPSHAQKIIYDYILYLGPPQYVNSGGSPF